MPRLPLTIGPFNPEDAQGIFALGYRMARRVKDYLDDALEPFLGSRVLIIVGAPGGYDSGSRTITVASPSLGTFYAEWRLPGEPSQQALDAYQVRVLWDSRTHTAYFDDWMADA